MKFYVVWGHHVNRNEEILEFENQREAEEWAYQNSIESYDSYAGLHGIMSIEDIMEEEDVDYETAEEIYAEYRENEINYNAEVFDENNEYHSAILEDQGRWSLLRLIFKDKNKKEHVIIETKDERKCNAALYNYIKNDLNFESYYSRRIIYKEQKIIEIDYGSWNSFFYIILDEDEDIEDFIS